MRLSLLLGLILFSLPSGAATGPTITGVGGASGFSGTGTATIFGGLAGDDPHNGDANTPGNSCVIEPTCATKPLCPCNTARINNGLILTINLSNQTTANGTTTTTSGNAYALVGAANTGTGGTSTSSSIPINTNLSNGGSAVTIPWSSLCSAMGSNDCEALTSGASLTLNIYIDANNNGVDGTDPYTPVSVKVLKPDPDTFATYGSKNFQGIGSFTPYPGDGKIYIKDAQTTQDFPLLSYATTIKGVRVFAAETNLPDANARSASKTQDLPVSDDGSSLAKNIIDGLNNGTRYFIRVAMLDEAQNVVMYSPDPAVDVDKAGATECATPSGATVGACAYSAIPQKVEGLLPDDLNCFVATAAYGSFLEPKLVTFREFRRRVLLGSAVGRRLNHLYYRYGPYAARYIQNKPAWRAVTRAALWPAFGLSWATLRFGFTNVLVSFLIGVIGAVVLLQRRFSARD